MEHRATITKQQADLYLQALARRSSAQAEVTAILGTILAGLGVEEAANVRIEWKNRQAEVVYEASE